MFDEAVGQIPHGYVYLFLAGHVAQGRGALLHFFFPENQYMGCAQFIGAFHLALEAFIAVLHLRGNTAGVQLTEPLEGFSPCFLS